MGTNYYAYIIPTKKKKDELKKMIDDDELVKALEAEGYKMISKTLSDFYSDGLRFSTTTHFDSLIDVT